MATLLKVRSSQGAVAAIPCKTYNQDTVSRAVRRQPVFYLALYLDFQGWFPVCFAHIVISFLLHQQALPGRAPMNIKELSENLGLEEDEYMEMLDLFLTSGGADLSRIEKALKEANAKLVHEAAHSLKGSAGSLCLDNIFELARDIDDKSRKGILKGIDVLARDLRRSYDELVTAVNPSN